MITVGPKSISECVSQVIEGLKARGLYPEGKTRAVSSEKAAAAAPANPPPRTLKETTPASRPTMEGERKQVTVLFAIVSGLTSGSEGMDPERVRDLVRKCVAVMTEEVHRYDGTVAHLRSDGVMAPFWRPRGP